MNKIKELFEDIGYKVEKRLTEMPSNNSAEIANNDFIFVCHSSCFLVSTREFSKIIKEIVSLQGKTVIDVSAGYHLKLEALNAR